MDTKDNNTRGNSNQGGNSVPKMVNDNPNKDAESNTENKEERREDVEEIETNDDAE